MNKSISSFQNQDNASDLNEHEISPPEILCFLKSTYKTIGIAGLAGVLAAIAYLAIVPRQYEAISQVMMAQIGAPNNNGINIQGANIEDPMLLIVRMSSPTSFTPQLITACGLDNKVNAALELSKSIKLTVPKGVANVVELKTFGKSAGVARECNIAMFDLIKATQSLLVAPLIEEAKVKLANVEERLSYVKNMMAKTDKSGDAISASYLSARDEIRYLLDEISYLKNFIISSQNRVTRLIAPVYASDMPFSPKKRVALAAGFLGGLFFGLLFELVRKAIAKLKSEMRGVL